MATLIYETSYFDFSSVDGLARFLRRAGIPAKVELSEKFKGIEVTVPLGTPAQPINDAVDAATMHYCDECTARLKRINNPSLCAQCALDGRTYFCSHPPPKGGE